MLEHTFIDLVEEDSSCFECGIPNTTYASVSLCVLLCEKCAMKHRELGMHISYIKPLNDQWSDPLLNNMLKGGNARLRLFMENFGIGKELGLDKKYDCRALEYYRLLLRAEIDGREVPMKKPTRAEALEPYFAKKLKDESDESVGILNSVTCLLSSATSKIVNTAEGVYHKSLDLTSSIWSSLPEINKIPSATLDIFHSAADLMSSITLAEPSKAPDEAFEMKEFYKEAEGDFFSGLDLAKSLNFSTETDIAEA